MALAQEIHARLTKAFAPEVIEVINESHKHAGHAGDDGSGESHWHVVIRAAAFDGQTRLGRHRAIHTALGPDVMGRLHALALTVQGPGDAAD
ncbi:MAG: BolA family transcriptional regulator [Rhodobacterales bacterium]|nr:BolA family transcriptional regulator [Rhodobacterales bacterium]